MAADPVGFIDVKTINENRHGTKVMGAIVTPGVKTEYLDDTPATMNAVNANAFPIDYDESTKDAAVGTDKTKGDGGF